MPKSKPQKNNFVCENCKAVFHVEKKGQAKFCPACGTTLGNTSILESLSDADSSASLVKGHIPKQREVQYDIGPFQIIRSIGKGGMGEVLLAYDTVCGRKIAIKRIRQDLLEFRQIQKRFIKEARVTSQLTHPGIIPIYSIHQENNQVYYTMPFVEGETLKQLIRRSRALEKNGEKTDAVGGSIPSLVRIFISICQAIAYAHSKSVLHRDIKPENILLGKYGEVLILDWGLAKVLTSPNDDTEEIHTYPEGNPLHHITILGKVVGTVAYMAPERALGKPASFVTDIYSLGVILYQILTLRLPFKRGKLTEFRATLDKEVLQDPLEVAPYRDIPKVLTNITFKCLAKDPEQRYQSVDALIKDLEGYLEGRSEWQHSENLSVERKEDWEFQENILIPEHRAITRSPEFAEWVHLMISKNSFSENVKIKAKVKFKENCSGIGFLFNVPESTERTQINDGYCLWLSSKPESSSKLLRTSLEILPLEDLSFKKGRSYEVIIEKIDYTIRLLIDGVEQFTYISRTPIVGTHIGILSKDLHYNLETLEVFTGSQNIMVNCLAIPDAFLSHKDYHQALSEYRRIGYAFPGRAESREAILRAGITLLEQAKSSHGDETKDLYDLAFSEFEKLHQTAGAPLGYLGKALGYKALNDIEEEAKCFEIAYRRYPNHPLLHTLHEQVIFRLEESSHKDRKSTYHFLLLALCHVPDAEKHPSVKKISEKLWEHCEWLDFLRINAKDFVLPLNKNFLIIFLGFCLSQAYIVEENLTRLIQEKIEDRNLIKMGFLSLLYLNRKDLIDKIFNQEKSELQNKKLFCTALTEVDPIKSLETLLKTGVEDILHQTAANYFMDRALDNEQFDALEPLFEKMKHHPFWLQRKVWSYLLRGKWKEAGEIFESFSLKTLSEETSLWNFLYGVWLYATEGEEIAMIHWNSLLPTAFPRTWIVGSYALSHKLDRLWNEKAFDWEKSELRRQLHLFEITNQLR